MRSMKARVPELCDGAERLDQLVAAMPMPLSSTDRRFCRPLSAETVIAGFGSSPSSSGTADRLEAQLLAGVRRVGDQLAHEHVAVRIDRMHHHVQQAGDVRLEGVGGGVRRGVRRGHGSRLLDCRWRVGGRVAAIHIAADGAEFKSFPPRERLHEKAGRSASSGRPMCASRSMRANRARRPGGLGG
jgi:hypothetical protein